MPSNEKSSDPGRLDRVVAEARRNRDQREQDYRERALKLYPWICGRCGREFNLQNLHELTVHPIPSIPLRVMATRPTITITTLGTAAIGNCCACTAMTTSTSASLRQGRGRAVPVPGRARG